MVIFSEHWVLDHLRNTWKGLLCVRDFRFSVGKCKPSCHTCPAFTRVDMLWNNQELKLSVLLPEIAHTPASICVFQTCLTGNCFVNYHTNRRAWQKIVKVQTQALYVGTESWTKVTTALHAEDTGRGPQGWYNILPVSLREQEVALDWKCSLLWGCVRSKQDMGSWTSSPASFMQPIGKRDMHCLEIACITSNTYFIWEY